MYQLMALADCTELEKNISRLAEHLWLSTDAKNLDDVAKGITKLLPGLSRDMIIDAIVKASARELKETDEAIKTYSDITRQAKVESRTRRMIGEVQRYLEYGIVPEPKKKGEKPQTETQILKDHLSILRQQLRQSDPAVAKRFEKSIARLEAKILSGDLAPKPRIKKELSDDLKNLQYKKDMLQLEIRDRIRDMEPKKITTRIGEAWDFVRIPITTGEFSFAMRQGGVYMLTHPLKWGEALVAAFQSLSKRSYHELNTEIKNRKNAPMYLKSKLGIIREGMPTTSNEDILTNSWQNKLPVIRNFSQAAAGFMNKARADLFDIGVATLSATGQMTQEEAEIWANYINIITGRGNLYSWERATLPLNRLFFSVRYVASRFQLLMGQPLWHKAGKGSWRVRKMIALEYAKLGIGLFAIYILGSILFGGDTEDDPRSSNFGKLMWGNRRLDVLMGHGQIVVFAYRLWTGQYKTSKGKIQDLYGKNWRYGNKEVKDVMFDFLRSKLSPQFGMAMDLLTRKNFVGEEVTLYNTVAQKWYPITYGDIYEVMQEDGVDVNVTLSVLALLGMGLQTYDSSQAKQQKHAQTRTNLIYR
jgi:hypothetical protein